MNGGSSMCGMLHLRLAVSTQWWFSVTGTVSGAPRSFQSGMSSLSAIGSTTAPDRMRAPISLPFSRMQTESSRLAAFASCFSRMAALRPAGPPPTITTSYCMDSRSLMVLRRVLPRHPHISTHPPCQFLDHGVNGGRGSSGGRGLEYDRYGRGAQRSCLVARGGCRRRYPGRAAQLDEAACALRT